MRNSGLCLLVVSKIPGLLMGWDKMPAIGEQEVLDISRRTFHLRRLSLIRSFMEKHAASSPLLPADLSSFHTTPVLKN
jgi:hypothetical protein